MPDKMFIATTVHNDEYGWKENAMLDDAPLPSPPQPPVAWPNVSYHGRVDPATKKLHDAVIEQEEEKAWRTRGKVVPERRHAFHGEDEARAVGKEPFSCAGGYPTRGRTVQSTGGPGYTRNGTGSSYAWPRAEHPPKVRMDAAGVARQKAEAAADKPHIAAPSTRAAPRTRADDFHSTEAVKHGLRLENAPAAHKPTGSKRVTVAQPGLMSAAAWKRQLNERARSAMPGAMREHARQGRPGERPESARPWIRTGINGRTGAGTEPLRLGEHRDPRAPSAVKPFMWHTVAARRYK